MFGTPIGCQIWAVGDWGSPDFPLELLQQFLSFAIIMDTVIQEDDTITHLARAFALDGFIMAQWPFTEIDGTFIWNKSLLKQ
ncbi:hypothetical protein AVEN_1000-1 [Araneus ventricosus]|uniref:Uncharacterized protein n=1 Tax=Araneus ventricosus TaxID=182803 RepID=A0A4Y2CWJ2_ARAVE|nr:hypothetical protein AVEN_1000-1 [Araneus ventricosus]